MAEEETTTEKKVDQTDLRREVELLFSETGIEADEEKFIRINACREARDNLSSRRRIYTAINYIGIAALLGSGYLLLNDGGLMSGALFVGAIVLFIFAAVQSSVDARLSKFVRAYSFGMEDDAGRNQAFSSLKKQIFDLSSNVSRGGEPRLVGEMSEEYLKWMKETIDAALTNKDHEITLYKSRWKEGQESRSVEKASEEKLAREAKKVIQEKTNSESKLKQRVEELEAERDELEVKNKRLKADVDFLEDSNKFQLEIFESRKSSFEKRRDEFEGHIEEVERKSREEIERSHNSTLTEIDVNTVIRHISDRVSGLKPEDIDVETVSVLYAVLHDTIPDMERVKEVSLIPNEMLRAQQIELIVERYSKLITDVEHSDLPPTEKRDKINAYRLARERELGIEE